MFAVAAIKLKKLYRKNSIKTIGENTIHVSDVERKGTATEATVELEDETGKGKVLLTFWGPNKKTKETTIQVNTTKGTDKKFVNLFADKFVRPVIDKVANGIGIGNFFKKQGNTKIPCDICDTNFIFKTDLKDHKFKKHKEIPNSSNKVSFESKKTDMKNIASNKCDECDFTADNDNTLNEHIKNDHYDFWLIGSKRRKKDNETVSNNFNKVMEDEDEITLSKRRDQRILEKREYEEKQEEQRKKKAEENRVKALKDVDNKNQTKIHNKQKRNKDKKVNVENKVDITPMEVDDNVKELPPSVKCLHPDCIEFVVPGNGACCLNCLAAFIYLDANEGPKLGRDLNTHMATYRGE